MIGRLLVFWGLALDAFLRGDIIAGAACVLIPFTGSTGMYFTVAEGAIFAYKGHWIEAVISWGYLGACLYGNRRRSVRDAPAYTLDQGLGYWTDPALPPPPPPVAAPPVKP
jgi:hypothetical protein